MLNTFELSCYFLSDFDLLRMGIERTTQATRFYHFNYCSFEKKNILMFPLYIRQCTKIWMGAKTFILFTLDDKILHRYKLRTLSLWDSLWDSQLHVKASSDLFSVRQSKKPFFFSFLSFFYSIFFSFFLVE